jgi:paired amphipathic helix protein Sin3a
MRAVEQQSSISPKLTQTWFSRPNALQQQVSQAQVGGNVLLPPSYHPSGPPSGHTLPTLADLTQGNQSAHHQQQTPYNTHPPPPNSGHSLPGLGHTLQQSPQAMLNQEREREARERERREMELMERQRHREELHMREQEQMNRERELAERAHREQLQHHPVQSHTGSIPIHQPVASKVPNTIHGPNGLLSNLGSGSLPSNTIPASNGPSGLFNLGSQQQESAPRPAYLHPNAPPPPPQSIAGFAGPGPSPMPGHAAIGQQQPILNVSLYDIVTVLQRIDLDLNRMRLAILIKSRSGLMTNQMSTTDFWTS